MPLVPDAASVASATISGVDFVMNEIRARRPTTQAANIQLRNALFELEWNLTGWAFYALGSNMALSEWANDLPKSRGRGLYAVNRVLNGQRSWALAVDAGLLARVQAPWDDRPERRRRRRGDMALEDLERVLRIYAPDLRLRELFNLRGRQLFDVVDQLERTFAEDGIEAVREALGELEATGTQLIDARDRLRAFIREEFPLKPK